MLSKYGTEQIGISTEVALADLTGIEVDHVYRRRGRENLVRHIQPALAPILSEFPSPVAHVAEGRNPIDLLDAAGHELARGLANYAAGELRSISGQQSDQITALLGYEYGDEVIHRDHLVLLARPGSAL